MSSEQPFNNDSLGSVGSNNGLLKKILTGKIGYVLAILFALLFTCFAGYRAHSRYANPKQAFDFSKTGMSDFHNGAYFPSQAFANRINPYATDVCEHYPMARSAPPYSPVVFILYQPFTWLDLPAADITFFAFNLLLIGGLAWCTVETIGRVVKPNSQCLLNWFGDNRLAAIWAFGLVMLSRPGHITMFTGYFTVQLVIGTLMSLHYSRSKPWLAGIGMLLASGKPTYIIPLAILMFFRRDFKALTIGLIMCAVVAAAGIGWLSSSSGLTAVIDGIRQGQAAFDEDPTELPVFIWTRLDAMGVLAKINQLKPSGMQYLVAMLITLIPIGLSIWRVRDKETNQESFGLTASIICLALLVSIYHHSYDAMLILPVWLALLMGGKPMFSWLYNWERWALFGLLTVPVVNYAATLRFRELFQIDNLSITWNVLTSLNGVCLIIALLILMVVSLRKQPALKRARKRNTNLEASR